MAGRFDATIKELAALQPAGFLQALTEPTTLPVRLLNVDLSTVSTSADLVFGLGEPLQEIRHVEVQTGPDKDLPKNTLSYNTLLYRQYEVPVRSLIVLLHSKAQLANLTGGIEYQAGGTRLEFHYETIRLWTRPVATLLQGPLNSLPLAVLAQLPQQLTQDEELAQVIGQIAERLEVEAAAGQTRQLMTAAYLLTGLRTSRERARTIFQGVTLMHESSTYQAILDEGELRGAKKMLLKQGEIKLGPPSEAHKAAITATEDLEWLDRLIERILAVTTWDELMTEL